ncbi:hypothetical protein DXT76_01080 [Halobacillus trueperi]|uniref:Uncharacterized protein n=1 Tax=Halobacillus trueperi TaxID=156205 RepID=A0A3D8VTH5_9BACI|nr:hypothetical protein [Halobacillus trueperi]RDY72563.1 hypothetical protein DXT76_01080 [Halobacillus trueperi]
MRMMVEVGNRKDFEAVLQQANGDREAIDMAMRFHGTMRDRGIELTPDEIDFAKVSYHVWNYEKQMPTPIVNCAPAGFGKSTMLQTWVEHKQRNSKNLFGAIVVKQKIEQVKEFAKAVNESTGELTAYPLLGRANYETEKEYKEQFDFHKQAPVLVLTHKMLEILTSQEKLPEFSLWYDSERQARRRTQLIIDERPQFIELTTISATQLEQFTELVKVVSHKANGEVDSYYSEVKKQAEKLREELLKDFPEGENVFHIQPIDSQWDIPQKLFYDWIKYAEELGMDYNLLGAFKQAITHGGTVDLRTTGSKRGTCLTLARNIWQDITFMNTVILDASAVGDEFYGFKQFNKIAPITPKNAYEGMTIYNCSKHNIGRSFFDQHEKALQKSIELAQHVSKQHSSTLVVVYKELRKDFEKQLSEELESGVIKIKHFDDERASNDFRDCDAVLFLGINRKGLTYYIENARAIHNQDVDLESSTNGGLHFKDQKVNNFYVSDMATDRQQGIGRLRPYKKATETAIYMFSMDESLPKIMQQAHEGSELKVWKLPFSLTSDGDGMTAKEKFMSWLEEFSKEPTGSKVKKKEVYSDVLGCNSKTLQRLVKDSEVTSKAEELEVSFKGHSIIKN